MKPVRIFLVFAFLLGHSLAWGQYRVWVYEYTGNVGMDDLSKVKGFLSQLTDSSLVVTTFVKETGLAINREIPIRDIEKLKLRKKGRVGKGVLSGTLAAMGLGAIIGLASGDDKCDPGGWCIFLFTAEEKALMNAIGLSPFGAVAGGLIGGSKRKVEIHGSLQQYEAKKEDLREYLKRD